MSENLYPEALCSGELSKKHSWNKGTDLIYGRREEGARLSSNLQRNLDTIK